MTSSDSSNEGSFKALEAIPSRDSANEGPPKEAVPSRDSTNEGFEVHQEFKVHQGPPKEPVPSRDSTNEGFKVHQEFKVHQGPPKEAVPSRDPTIEGFKGHQGPPNEADREANQVGKAPIGPNDQETLKAVLRDVAAMKTNSTRMQEEIHALQEDKTEMKEQMDTLQEDNTKLLEQIDALEEEKTRMQKKIDSLTTLETDNAAEISGLKVKLMESQKETKAAIRSNKKITSEKNDISKKLLESVAEAKRLQEQLTQAKSSTIESQEAEKESLSLEIEELSEKITEFKNMIHACKTALQDKDTEIASLKEKRSKDGQELANLTLRKLANETSEILTKDFAQRHLGDPDHYKTEYNKDGQLHHINVSDIDFQAAEENENDGEYGPGLDVENVKPFTKGISKTKELGVASAHKAFPEHIAKQLVNLDVDLEKVVYKVTTESGPEQINNARRCKTRVLQQVKNKYLNAELNE